MADLARFVAAQDAVWPAVQAELAAGEKQSHWMWFVFPQLAGLGHSDTARFYGLADLDEARAYTAHAVLGTRLRASCARLLAVQGRSATEILGSPDDLKLRACMTLFERAAPDEPVFAQVLDRFYGGARDALTLKLLAR